MRARAIGFALTALRYAYDSIAALTPEPLICPVPVSVYVTTPFPPNQYSAAQLALALAVAEEVGRGQFWYLEPPAIPKPKP